MPDTFGKRQRDAAKARRRETKEARRAARKAGLADPTGRLLDLPGEAPAGEAVGPTATPEPKP